MSTARALLLLEDSRWCTLRHAEGRAKTGVSLVTRTAPLCALKVLKVHDGLGHPAVDVCGLALRNIASHCSAALRHSAVRPKRALRYGALVRAIASRVRALHRCTSVSR